MIDEQEILRKRWRRERQRLHLDDLGSEGFGTGGLGKFLDRPAVRLLVLPKDPVLDLIEFDKEFWEWFREDRTNPSTDGLSDWGSMHRPTSEAAVRAHEINDKWSRYLALLRHGGMEMGLGDDAIYKARERTGFRLVTIVGRVWCALDQYREILGRYSVEGPWQVVLVLIQTKGTLLGNVAGGWEEPHTWGDGRLCCEQHLAHVVELDCWPDAEATKQVAFRLGAWIEDCWGHRERRFIARTGPLQGQFDKSK